MEENYMAINHYVENAIFCARLSLEERDKSASNDKRIKLIIRATINALDWGRTKC